MVRHFYQDLPGHFNFHGLYCDEVNRAQDGAKFVEVGVWRGCSLAFLAVQALNSGKQISIIGVDAFEASPDEPMKDQKFVTIDRVRRPFIEHGAGANVVLIKSLSWEAAESFYDLSLDFVFIDAGHDYESVKKDLAAWWPKVKPGGTFAGHDYTTDYPGVIQAVEEKFGGPQRRVATSWVVTK